MELTEIVKCDDVQRLCDALRCRSAAILHNVAEIAAIVRRLDELGADVTIDDAMLPYYRLIGHGQLSAKCFSALCGEPALLEKVRQLPMPLQEKIADGEPLKVMQAGGDCRMVRPIDMTTNERKQVFRGKRLRTDAEQIGYFRERAESQRAKAAVSEPNDITVDRKRKGIVVNGRFLSVSELANFVATLS